MGHQGLCGEPWVVQITSGEPIAADQEFSHGADGYGVSELIHHQRLAVRKRFADGDRVDRFP